MNHICLTSTDSIDSFDEDDGGSVDEDHILDADVCALPSALVSNRTLIFFLAHTCFSTKVT